MADIDSQTKGGLSSETIIASTTIGGLAGGIASYYQHLRRQQLAAEGVAEMAGELAPLLELAPILPV